MDKYKWTKLMAAVVVSVCSLIIGQLTEKFDANLPWFIILCIVIVIGIIVGVGAEVQSHNQEKRVASEKTDVIHTAYGSVWSMSHAMGKVVDMNDADRQACIQLFLYLLATDLLAQMTPRHHKPRVTVYTLSPDPEPLADGGMVFMEPIAWRGRPRDTPRPFATKTKRGDAVLKYVMTGDIEICPDTSDKSKVPEGWEGTSSHYKSFATCPITNNESVYGMLTVDSVDVNKMEEFDGSVVATYAALAGLVLQIVASGGYDEPRRTEGDPNPPANDQDGVR